MSAKIRDTTYFGEHDLPQKQKDTLRKAIRVERINIVVKIIAVVAIFSVAGSSQAMKAAWIEDALALLPPIAFLVAIRFLNKKPTPRHPYGFHRSIGVGHLVASVALLGMGTYLLVDSAMGLIAGDRPPIGLIEIFGTPIWAGWLMIAVSVIVVIPSIIIGRINWKLAPVLHNKVLYADGDMNKADWMTGLATAVGILGVGFGLWWFDAAVAIFISLDIISDGVKNLRGCLAGLIDARATTTDSKEPHDLIFEVREKLTGLDWVDEADVRMRDQGQVFHTEVFVVPYKGQMPSLDEVEDVREKLSDIDWKLHDLVLIPVAELPEEFLPQIDDKEE
ncbi:MAG TPA: cation transporter [Enteractinococcus sp.]